MKYYTKDNELAISDMTVHLGFMNMTLLRAQKTALVNMMMDDSGRLSNDELDAVEGIVNLLDAIQDYAVDHYGCDENEVFNFTPDEEDTENDNF